MDENMVERLLKCKTKNETIPILKENEELLINISLWHESVIKHVMKITGMDYEELKQEVSPIDKLY